MIDINELKFSLTIEQVLEYVNYLGGDGIMVDGNTLTFLTICHHPLSEIAEASRKLYYYDNTHLFKCYTRCEEVGGFDIYELTKKVKTMETGTVWSLFKAYAYVGNFFGVDTYSNTDTEGMMDWDVFNLYENINDTELSKTIIEHKQFDKNILKKFPQPIIEPWVKEGIKKEVMDNFGVCYNPATMGIVIPHFDKDNNLIGIRERTLIREEEKYGKYKPAIINYQMYNHPLGYNLYNLNNSKDNIRKSGIAIVYEGEKSTMLHRSYFGAENDISVAVCGSNLTAPQVNLLLDAGAKEIVIAFDKQFKIYDDEECRKWGDKLIHIAKQYGKLCRISWLFDWENKLGYKMSPIDNGLETFLYLFQRRVSIDEN